MRTGGRAVAVLAVAALCATALSQADVVGGTNVRASFRGWLTPKALPRHGRVPVALHLRGRLWTTDGREPPPLDSVAIAINRHGRVTTAGLPVCPLGRIEAETTRKALASCRGALVGRGTFSAHIVVPEQAPFPANGTVLAFNSRRGGHPVILAHIYGTQPIPIVQVLTMSFRHPDAGRFRTTLSVPMPTPHTEWGHVTGFSLDLARRYVVHGRQRSLVSAGCPAPPGFQSADFTAAKGVYHLTDGRNITRVVSGRCTVAR